MPTVNNRVKKPQAMIINGIDAGGVMTASISAGYDNKLQSAPDGLQVALEDKLIPYVRGQIVSQDWVEAVKLLTEAETSLVFYERRSGVAEDTGYIKHTITNPVINTMSLSFNKGSYATVQFSFECRAADGDAGIAEMWQVLDGQSAPVTYVTAARGGYQVESCTHGALSINHVTGFNFTLTMPLLREWNDGAKGYTMVECELSGLTAAGSINFQDGDIHDANNTLLCQQLLVADRGDLVLTVKQGRGATSKVITIAGVEFDAAGSSSDAASDFTGYNASFDVTNDPVTHLTLKGPDNKIIAITDAV